MLRRTAVVICVLLLLAPSAIAAKWPKIPPEEQQLTAAPGHPNAAAVVLRQEGKVFISKDSRSSYLDVYTRIKILTQEGVDFGSISL